MDSLLNVFNKFPDFRCFNTAAVVYWLQFDGSTEITCKTIK